MKTFNHVGNDLIDLPVEYVDGKRFYVTPKGEHYISVTTILSNLSKASIQKWRNRVGEKEGASALIKEWLEDNPNKKEEDEAGD